MSHVEFLAALAGTNSSAKWLSVSSEGDARLVLETSASELAQVMALVGATKRLLKIRIEWSEE